MKNKFKILSKILLIKALSIQKGSILYIEAPIEASNFIQVLTEVAYKMECKYVDIEYYDYKTEQIRYKYSKDEYLEYYPKYLVNKKINMTKEKIAIIKFNQGITKDLKFDTNKKQKVILAMKNSLLPYTKIRRNKNFTTCSTIIPTKYWAKQIYPNLRTNDALKLLWNNIFDISKCKIENPLEYWENHINNISNRRNYLNNKNYEKLHIFDDYSNFTVKLVKNHLWVGGCEYTKNNLRCMPNFPSEEIFTACDKYGINGIVKSSKPLIYQNNIIENFTLEFKNGKIINYYAEKGYTFLKQLIELDDTTHYCGEIALLQSDTIISKTNTIYKNTLLDENAASHMAIGCAYPINIKNTINYNYKDFNKNNLNFSKIHCDFMFGRNNTTIIAFDENGNKETLIKSGKWMI